MSIHPSLIDELEGAVDGAAIGRRADILHRVTNLFVSTSSQLSNEQIALFDEVMMHLLKEIDSKGRAIFGLLLVDMTGLPSGVVRELALDDAIEVAGPMLARFERIGENVLVESAMTKSQQHLLAISQRPQLSESVTDVLVVRGNEEVAISTAGNPGASFSDLGYSTLVKRADGNAELAARVWNRAEIPRQYLLTLFAEASQAVQCRLQSTDPRRANEIGEMIVRARDSLQAQSRERSVEHVSARRRVQAMHDAGNLSETDVFKFAYEKRFDETAYALALLCDLPIGLVERAMAHDQYDQLLVLAKSIGLSFESVREILWIRGGPSLDMNEADRSFSKLRPETAKKTLQYYRLRERTA
jgi:uncharacterized protein (DUF2336 family)